MFLLFITQHVMTELRTVVTPRVVKKVTSTEIATATVTLLDRWCGAAINEIDWQLITIVENRISLLG